MTKKVKIEKLKIGESAYPTVAPDYLKEMFNNRKYSWDSGYVEKVDRGDFYEVCTCLSKNKEEASYHTTISENGQCILCDHYTFDYELKGNRKITKYTEKQILKIKEDREKICPKKVMKLMNKYKLNVGKVAEKLKVCEIKLDKEILNFAEVPCGRENGINVKRYFSNIKDVEEIIRVCKIHEKRKDQAEELNMTAKAYSTKLKRYFRYFPWLKSDIGFGVECD